MSYVSQHYDLCTDANIYAYMVNSACKYHDVISAIFDLGKETCSALPFFNAFTGCDTVSSFFWKRKYMAWDAGLAKSMMSTGNDLRKPPPSQEALIHHTKLECYQAGYLWKDSIDNFDLPDPKSWESGKKKVMVIMVLCVNQHR